MSEDRLIAMRIAALVTAFRGEDRKGLIMSFKEGFEYTEDAPEPDDSVIALEFDAHPESMAAKLAATALFLEVTEGATYGIAMRMVTKVAETREEAGIRPSDDEGPTDATVFFINMGKGRATTYITRDGDERGGVYLVPNPESPLLRKYLNLAPGDELRDEVASQCSHVPVEVRRAMVRRHGKTRDEMHTETVQ